MFAADATFFDSPRIELERKYGPVSPRRITTPVSHPRVAVFENSPALVVVWERHDGVPWEDVTYIDGVWFARVGAMALAEMEASRAERKARLD